MYPLCAYMAVISVYHARIIQFGPHTFHGPFLSYVMPCFHHVLIVVVPVYALHYADNADRLRYFEVPEAGVIPKLAYQGPKW